ncbi:hypothetical protein FB593_102558 [Rhizobium sp. SJZ105]|uniref:hypothetical protein n=1 Tax=Rhizobium sp. SJZ105 TaxID=2572678 RepID=UPI0011AAF966|nr:hypothetical protein [Rhizobium sp. SJZ105]TWC85704.1 hypothetical protein FB593_102558 [Rhizobium sp. SJZ105]
MFKDNTVFVIGAGASAEFGLPVGSALTQTIKSNCSFRLDEFGSRLAAGSREVFQHYEKIFGRNDSAKVAQFNLRLEKSRQIARGIDSAESIDEYIFRYASDPLVAEIGKLQIAHAISLAENKSILSDDNNFPDNFSVGDTTWIWTFAKALMNGVKVDDVACIEENISIICFNYDRCIEHYLEHALMRGFHELSLEDARKIVGQINIIHPYGWLGNLGAFPFGKADRFANMAENLITWSETISDPEVIEKLRSAVRSAHQLVFMGFGFAAQNMDLLNTQPTGLPSSHTQVYSTGLGIPQEVEVVLKEKIIALTSSSWRSSSAEMIHFQYGAECKKFLDIHRLNLVK